MSRYPFGKRDGRVKKNYIYAITTVLIWSTMAAMVKSLLSGLPDLETLSVSSACGFLFLLMANIRNGSLKKLRDYRAKDIACMAGLGFVGLFLYSALYYRGLGILSSQEACILNYLWPIMLVFFSTIILGEKMTVIKVAAMFCSFMGIVILSSGGSAGAAENRMAGIICCIVAAAFYGLFSVLNKKADYDQNTTMMVIWLTVAACAAVASFVAEKWVPIFGMQWIGILWLGVVIDAVAYLLWALALRGSDNTAAIANMAYLTPFLSLMVSAVFLKEKIHLRAILALVFIMGGIIIQSVCDGRRRNKTR